MEKITIREYKKSNPLPSIASCALIAYITYHFTPYLAVACIRRDWSPNKMTLAMIITGIIGGIFLFIPNMPCKFLSIFLYLLWYTWDTADGQVARYTNVFSNYGRQLDWLSHLICHPLFIVALTASYIQLYTEFIFEVILTSVVLLISELINRSLIAMSDEKMVNHLYSSKSHYSIFTLSYVRLQLGWFPNYTIIYTTLLIVDQIFKFDIFPFVYIAFSLVYSIAVLKKYVKLVVFMYKG